MDAGAIVHCQSAGTDTDKVQHHADSTVSVYFMSGDTGHCGPSEAFQDAADFVHEVKMCLRKTHGLPYYRTSLLQVGRGGGGGLLEGSSWDALGRPCELQAVVKQPEPGPFPLDDFRASVKPHLLQDLLAKGLDPNVTDEHGKTLSHHVLESSLSIPACLMFAKSPEQIRHMILTADTRKVTMLQQLWLACADFTIADKGGKTALELAADSSSEVRKFCAMHCIPST